jgi:hypothetical protein
LGLRLRFTALRSLLYNWKTVSEMQISDRSETIRQSWHYFFEVLPMALGGSRKSKSVSYVENTFEYNTEIDMCSGRLGGMVIVNYQRRKLSSPRAVHERSYMNYSNPSSCADSG